MSIPSTANLLRPLLELISKKDEISLKDATIALGEKLELEEEYLRELQPSGRQTKFEKRVGWAKHYLGKAGLVESETRGYFSITPLGRRILKKQPDFLSIRNLEIIGNDKSFLDE